MKAAWRGALVAGLGLVLLLALVPARATAATKTWTGGVSNNWATAGNWDLNMSPTGGDDLVLTLDGFVPSNNDLAASVQLHSVTLSAAADPLGSFTIDGNAIVLQSGGSITSNHSAGNPDSVNVGVTLNGPATITLAGTQVLDFNGVITGTGGLTLVNNSGLQNQLRLGGVNSYTGSTTIGGTHRVHTFVDGAIPTTSAVIITGGGLSFNADRTIGSLAGTVGVVTETGAISVTTVTTGGDNTSTTYAGVLQNGTLKVALTKAGTGTFTLSGANPYTGPTIVNAGTLLVTGSLAAGSAVTVASGATLGGTGTIGGTVTALAGGRLAPGTSIGTLNVGGSVTWHGATTFAPTALFELSNSDTTSDRLAITGALTKGSGPRFVFDFQGTGHAAVYTLATFASTTFSAANFSYVNLAPGFVGAFAIVGGNTLRFTVSPAEPPTHDFSGDVKADILWRDTTGGAVAAWLINGTAIASTAFIANLATTWTAAGVGDFNGDAKADILWRDAAGNLAVWLLNGTTIAATGPIFPVSTTWAVVGLGDFNGDGKTDILWRDNAGQVAIWLMNGTNTLAFNSIGAVPTTLAVAGVGDFDGDGRADILWRDTASGHLEIWLMNGFAVTAVIPIGTVATTWTVSAVADFNGDGVADILWRNTPGGQVAIWFMNGTVAGTTSVASTSVIATIATTWTIALAQDFDGDGHADILWREDDGTVAIWLLNGPTIVTTGVVADVSTNWVPR